MPRMRLRTCASAGALALLGVLPAQEPVTFAALVHELLDLDRLTRRPAPDYRTVQWSSTDRRTKAPDQPGWFANADGFGQEPVPGFEQVLREPDADGVGEYLLGDVEGPGAIVRGWSAGMDGVLRVYLDGAEQPLFAGKGYDFLARRSLHLLPDWASLPPEVQRLLVQVDADYLPVPFARRLRVTWTGRIRDLHFYHLQIRRYAPEARVETFVPQALPPRRAPEPRWLGDAIEDTVELAADAAWQDERKVEQGQQLALLQCRVEAEDLPRALRGILLRIRFDGASVPQVESPLGDFFATGPGIHPLQSLPLQVLPDGTLHSRWPMPFCRQCRLELVNWSGAPARVHVARRFAGLAQPFDDRTLGFHALWRADHQLHARGGTAPVDLPFVTVLGQGRFVGTAVQIVNPPMDPRWRSNWWGEGDEKVFVDGSLTTLGTGAEDYFNYSWSRWDLFDHPYCGQPLASGPGNCGYVGNHRLQIADDLPFAQSLSFAMELWSHRPAVPLSWGRTVYFYARPGAVTDHRAPQPGDLAVPALPPWRPEDFALAGESLCWLPGAAGEGYRATAGKVDARVPTALVRSGAYLRWTAPPGGRLALPFAVPEQATYRLRLCVQHRPDAPDLQVLADAEPLRNGDQGTFATRCAHGERWLDLVFEQVALAKGPHELVLVCPQGGVVGVDLAGYELREKPAASLPGAVEAELWDVVGRTDGLDVEIQRLGAAWSAAHHRWVKATRAGDKVTFRLAAPRPGRYAVKLRLTSSWDYGIVRIDWNGAVAQDGVDLWCGTNRSVGVRELDLGERDLSQPAELTFTVTGHAAGNEAPHCFFGIDCAVLTPAAR
jgi:hypothetical protein